MARVHLFEIHDQAWCPRVLRDASTDFLQWLAGTLGYFAPAMRPLFEAMDARGEHEVLDLCSGAGGPWLGVLPRLSAARRGRLRVRLSDLFPNRGALRRAARAGGSALGAVEEAVDARHVPAALTGARTLFGSLHHFTPEEARAILADAVSQGRIVGIFEPQERRPLSMLSIFFLPLILLLATPFIRPFSVSRLVFTYLVPLVPFVVLFDGLVSCLRTYSPRELEALVAAIDAAGYTWRIGRAPMTGLPLRVTYLVGAPRS